MAPAPGDPAFDHAGHLVVNSLADPGDGTCDAAECTLREAIAAANQDPDPSEISFARNLTGPITLDGASAQLTITEDLSISGPKAGMIIQRNSADPQFRIFDIAKDPGTATIRFVRLTIRGGQSAQTGGGIPNAENLTLVTSTVSGNATATRGGGISNEGDLTLMTSTVSGNRASIAGGGIADFGGTVTLTNSRATASALRARSHPGDDHPPPRSLPRSRRSFDDQVSRPAPLPGVCLAGHAQPHHRLLPAAASQEAGRGVPPHPVGPDDLPASARPDTEDLER